MATKQSELLRGSGDGLRKAILAFVILAIVAAAQPAGAIDNGFRGQYRITQTQTGTGNCPVPNPPTHRIEVHYINGRVRDYGRAGRYSSRRLRVRAWPTIPMAKQPRVYKLRYDPANGFGGRSQGPGPQGCSWRVRLIPIG